MNAEQPIDVARDREGQQRWLPVFLQEALQAAAPRFDPATQPVSEVPYAYRLWFQHVLLIDGMPPHANLTADEAWSLLALSQARQQLQEEWMPCPGPKGRRCGRWLRKHETVCACGWHR